MDFGAMDISKMAGDDPRSRLAISPASRSSRQWRGRPAMLSRGDRPQMQKNWNVSSAFGATRPRFWVQDVATGLAASGQESASSTTRCATSWRRRRHRGQHAFAEVVPALSAGVVDCGVTGSLSGNTAGWAEVDQVDLSDVAWWSINCLAVNLDSWKRLDPRRRPPARAVQGLRRQDVTTVMNDDRRGRHCTPASNLPMGQLARRPSLRLSLRWRWNPPRTVEVPCWRLGQALRPECTKEWNETVGKALGLTARRRIGRLMSCSLLSAPLRACPC